MKPKRTGKRTGKRRCEDCSDNGWILFQDDSLQCCYFCEKFAGDLEAAAAFFKSPKSKDYFLQTIIVRARVAWPTTPTPQ